MKQMQKKTKRRLVVQYFLRKLQQRMEADKVNSLDAVTLPSLKGIEREYVKAVMKHNKKQGRIRRRNGEMEE